MSQQLPKRSEVKEEFTWRMEDMCPSDEYWNTLFKEVEAFLQTYNEFKGNLSMSADILYKCLKFDDELSEKVERLYVYAKQKLDQNTTNSKYQDYFSRAQRLSTSASSASSFITPEILSIDGEVLQTFMNSQNGIAHYKRVIELIYRKKAHSLTSEMEALLADISRVAQGASNIYAMFNNADLKFPSIIGEDNEEVAVTHGRFITLLESNDQRVREEAFHSLYSSYSQFKNTLAATFEANIKQAAFYAKARHYSSTRAYYLSDANIPESVYENLIGAVNKNLPLMHRYMSIRKKALALDELHMYDIYAPIVKDLKKVIPYETAKTMVLEGLKPLGKEYTKLLQEGFRNRWIDIYENEGKTSGAYSWGCYGSHPYVLLNYQDSLDNVFTLAHEMGHALHSYHSDHNQPYCYAGYKIFVAEVASTCNEALLIRHLLENTDDRKEKSYLINHFLESFRGTLFRQTMFAEFEAITHKKSESGETLTADLLCEIYHELNRKYYGEEIIIDADIDYEWARIPHFYTPFYVYQYATGFSAAMAISTKILNGEKDAVENYKKFLSSGSFKDPIDLLKICGIDMTSSKPVEDALSVFELFLDEIETLL